MKKNSWCICMALLLTVSGQGNGLPKRLTDKLDSMIIREMNHRAFPGASIAVGNREGILYTRSYGFQDYVTRQEVTQDDLYDMASCTKVLSTTFAIMYLHDKDLITMNETVGATLPEFAGTPVGTISVRELLTHTSGLSPQSFYQYLVRNAEGDKLFSSKRNKEYPHPIGNRLFVARELAYDTCFISQTPGSNYRKMGENLYINPAFDTVIHNRIIQIYNPSKRGKYAYDDTNFYLLKRIAEHKNGKTLDVMTREFFDKLGCRNTDYNPLERYDQRRIVPTENDVLLGRGLVRGYVHDELGAMQGGVGGNAGLFSTARDVSAFCEMMLNGGNYRDTQVLKNETVKLFTSSPLARQAIYRGLGFDKREPDDDLGGDACCGHMGYTGTFFWMDLENGYYLVFLCNRVNPTRVNSKLSTSGLRARLWTELSCYFRK